MTTPTKQAQRTPGGRADWNKFCPSCKGSGLLPYGAKDPNTQLIIERSRNATLTARVAELEQVVDGIANAKRFDRGVFEDDAAFVDWARSIARAVLAKGKA